MPIDGDPQEGDGAILGTEEFREQYEAAREIEQAQTLHELSDAGLNFLLFGGWAGKLDGVYAHHPKDIDIFVRDDEWDKWENSLGQRGFAVHDVPGLNKKEATRGSTTIDIHFVHENEDAYTETAPHGTFRFPKQGFEPKMLGETSLSVMTPELLHIMESGGPDRKGKTERLAALDKNIDPKKLEVIRQMFGYRGTEGGT
jgi:hypothetical protein